MSEEFKARLIRLFHTETKLQALAYEMHFLEHVHGPAEGININTVLRAAMKLGIIQFGEIHEDCPTTR